PDVEVLLGWTPEDRAWLSSPRLRGRTVLAGYALARAVEAGRLRYLPARLSAVPRLLTTLRPDVAVVTGGRRGRELVYSGTVGFGPAAARSARALVVEVDPDGPDLSGPPIEGALVATVERPLADRSLPQPRRLDAVDLAVGHYVTSVLPDDPT